MRRLTFHIMTFTGMLWVYPSLAYSMSSVDPELRSILETTINQADSFKDRYEAEVWLVDMSQRLSRIIKQTDTRLKILKAVHREANRAGLRPELVLAVIEVESAFDRFAISRVGARGMMQIMPFWKKEIGRPQDNLMDLNTNLRYGTTILKFYIDKENGDIVKGLARYNGSVGKTWYAERVLKVWEKRWFVNYGSCDGKNC